MEEGIRSGVLNLGYAYPQGVCERNSKYVPLDRHGGSRNFQLWEQGGGGQECLAVVQLAEGRSEYVRIFILKYNFTLFLFHLFQLIHERFN